MLFPLRVLSSQNIYQEVFENQLIVFFNIIFIAVEIMSVGQCYLSGVKTISSDAHKTKSWYRIRGSFSNFGRAPNPPSFLYRSPPGHCSHNMTDITSCWKSFRQLINSAYIIFKSLTFYVYAINKENQGASQLHNNFAFPM